MEDQPFSLDQLRAALQVGNRFWLALATDDDSALREVLAAEALNGLSPAPADTEPPAKRLRDFFGWSAEECGRMGLYTRGTRIGPTSIRVVYWPNDDGRLNVVPDGTWVDACRIEFRLDDGDWLVERLWPHDRPATETIDLRLALAALADD